MSRPVIIVTGSSRGLGREIALRFGRAGWAVCVNYLNGGSEASGVVETIFGTGGKAVAVRADVREFVQVEAMTAFVAEKWGRIDVLVNNAGVSPPEGVMLRLRDEAWDEILDTNLKGCFNCIKAVSKTMIKWRAGHIINIGSIAGLKGRAGLAAYSSAKAGVVGLTKAAAVELAPRGIRVNAVLPGYMLTEMGAGASDGTKEAALADNLLKMYSDPGEVAAFILHLSGMKAVSGQVFNLDSRII